MPASSVLLALIAQLLVWLVLLRRVGLAFGKWLGSGLGSCVYVATASSFFAVRWVWVRAYCADAAPLRPTAFGGHPARSAPPPTRGTRLPPEERRLARPISVQRWCTTPVAGPNYRGAAPHHFGTLRSVLHHFSERKTDENVISPEFAPSLPPTHPMGPWAGSVKGAPLATSDDRRSAAASKLSWASRPFNIVE